MQNWVEEFSAHSYIVPKVLSTNKRDNFYVFNSPAKAVITNFETISAEKMRMRLFLSTRDVAIIIDESTKLKNPDAQITKDLCELSDLFKIRTIMTGTPVANRPYDIWAQIYFLDHGNSLGTDFAEFKRSTNLNNDLGKNKEAREQFEQAVSGIFEKIAPFSVRETKKTASLDLPQKRYVTVKTTFAPKQFDMYKQILNELEIEVSQNNESFLDDDSVALKRLLRLNQITSNPKLIDDNYEEESAKEKKLTELLDTIVKRGEKCIVWSNYIDNIEYFAEKYETYKPRKIHGSMDMSERSKSVSVFKKDEECRVLFATPQAAKEGLTLTVANNVIFYDRGFNLDDYLQAQDRIHRISQKKQCNVYNIIVEGSIDEWIDRLLDAKQYAAFLAQGDIDLNIYREKVDYSYGDIIKEILQAGEETYGC